MSGRKGSRDFAERYIIAPNKGQKDRDDVEPPRVVDAADNPPGKEAITPAGIVQRYCKVHRARIEGLNYHCSGCGSVFCLSCIANVLLLEGKCMVCEAPVEISDEFRSLIDRAVGRVQPDAFTISGQVTMIAPEIWRRFDELELEEDVVDEIIDRLKYVPPEDRLKYINAYFRDEDEQEDLQ